MSDDFKVTKLPVPPVSIRCVPREGVGVVETFAGMFASDPETMARCPKITICNGRGTRDYLACFSGMDRVTVHHPTPGEQHVLYDMNKHRKSAWNAERWVRLGRVAGQDLLLMEDDCFFSNEWLKRLLECAVECEKQRPDRKYLLLGYHRVLPGCAASPVYKHPDSELWGILCVYVPMPLLDGIEALYKRNAEKWTTTVDTILDGHCKANDISVFYTNPSIVQHAGAMTSTTGHNHHNPANRVCPGFERSRDEGGSAVMMTCGERLETDLPLSTWKEIRAGLPSEWIRLVGVDGGVGNAAGRLTQGEGEVNVSAMSAADWGLVKERGVEYRQTQNISHCFRSLSGQPGMAHLFFEDDLRFGGDWFDAAMKAFDVLNRVKCHFILSLCCSMPLSEFEPGPNGSECLALRNGRRFWGIMALMMKPETSRLLSCAIDERVARWGFRLDRDSLQTNSIGDRVVSAAAGDIGAEFFTSNPNRIQHAGRDSICTPDRPFVTGQMFRNSPLSAASSAKSANSVARALFNTRFLGQNVSVEDAPVLPRYKLPSPDSIPSGTSIMRVGFSVCRRESVAARCSLLASQMRLLAWGEEAEVISAVLGEPPSDLEDGWGPSESNLVEDGGYEPSAAFALGCLRMAGVTAGCLYSPASRDASIQLGAFLDEMVKIGCIEKKVGASMLPPAGPGDLILVQGSRCYVVVDSGRGELKVAWSELRKGTSGQFVPYVGSGTGRWGCNAKRAWFVTPEGRDLTVKAVVRTGKCPSSAFGWILGEE